MADLIRNNKKLVVAFVAFILLIAGIIVKNNITGSASTAEPWERWSSEKRFGYVAAYYPESEGITSDEVMEYRTKLKDAMTEASIEVKEDSRGYIDSYSLTGTLEIGGTRNSNKSLVNVTAVGGDFFYFHPMWLLSGNYISEDDLMEDRVVIDEQTAWVLYGSYNVTGMRITIGGDYYYIAGVVRPGKTGSIKKTYGKRNRIFMSYKAYNKINPDAKITCYETVYPDLVTNFAYKTLRKTVGLSDDDSEDAEDNKTNKNIQVVNFCTRFGIANIWDTLLSYGERSAHTDGIIYPFWENEYRRIEDFLVLDMVWSIICIIVIVVAMFKYIVAAYKFVRDLIPALWAKIMAKVRR